jgi:hypothetical protein
MDQESNKFTTVTFLAAYDDKGADAITKHYKIKGFPEFLVFNNGTQIAHEHGCDKTSIEKDLNQVKVDGANLWADSLDTRECMLE